MIEKGDKVDKVEGYRFPGVVVDVFYTLAGKRRVVVECTAEQVRGGLCHIFAPEQLTIKPRE